MTNSLIYITCKDQAQAKSIAEALLKERLIACANITEHVISMYWWEGKITQDTEAVIIAKSQSTLVPVIVDKVKALHSYSCPCIVAIPIDGGNPDYLFWIKKETSLGAS